MSDPRNATASWSWYLHQWKVGIFVALKEIARLMDEWKTEEDLRNWRIIYENAEDFDIQENDDSWLYIDSDWSWRVDSRHQVKAYKDWNNLNDYKDVLAIQKYIAERKKWGTSFYKKLDIKWFQIQTFDINTTTWIITEWDIEVNEDSRFLHTIEHVQWFWLSESDFNAKKASWAIKNNPDFIPNPNSIKLYPYPTWDYCDINSTDDKIRDWCNIEIERIKWSNSIQNIYESLLYLLDEKIRNKHSWWCPIFSFNELYSSIVSFLTFEEYDEMNLRSAFSDYWTEFKLYTNVSIKKEQVELLDEYMSDIYNKDYDWFIDELKTIHFYDRSFSKNRHIQAESFKQVIVKFLHNSSFKNTSELKTYLHRNDLILTSCITEESEKIRPVYSLVENIKDWNLELSLFSRKKLINKEINYKIEKFTDINTEIDKNGYSCKKLEDNNITKNHGIELISEDKLPNP